VLLAALVATGANFLSLRTFFEWNFKNSGCEKNLAERGFDPVAESALKEFALKLDTSKKDNTTWDVSVRAEGRTLIYAFRLKRPIVDMGAFNSFVSQRQKEVLEGHCSDAGWFLRSAKATETHTYYSFEGERLTSFSIGPADCPQW